MRKKKKTQDILKSLTQKEELLLIQGRVPKKLALNVKRQLKKTKPRQNWNQFLTACCISYLSEND